MSSTIYDAIKRRIVEAMQRGDTASQDFTRVVKAEMDRKGDGRPLPDTAEENRTPFEIEFLDTYLPREMSEAEIEVWGRANIDFSQFKPPMAVIAPVMKALGLVTPGDTVRKVIEKVVNG